MHARQPSTARALSTTKASSAGYRRHRFVPLRGGLLRRELSNYQRNALVRQYFPDLTAAGPKELERYVANLIKLITDRCGGLPPSVVIDAPIRPVLSKRYLELGGLYGIEDCSPQRRHMRSGAHALPHWVRRQRQRRAHARSRVLGGERSPGTLQNNRHKAERTASRSSSTCPLTTRVRAIQCTGRLAGHFKRQRARTETACLSCASASACS